MSNFQYAVPAVTANPIMPNGTQQPAPVAGTATTPVQTNVPPNPQPLSVAVLALDSGLRCFAKSATTLADFARTHPDEIETALEKVVVLHQQLVGLQTSTSLFAESSKRLDGVVEEAVESADWLQSQVTNGESNQPATVNNDSGRVFGSFDALLE